MWDVPPVVVLNVGHPTVLFEPVGSPIDFPWMWGIPHCFADWWDTPPMFVLYVGHPTLFFEMVGHSTWASTINLHKSNQPLDDSSGSQVEPDLSLQINSTIE
jgi:hypothetical protein